MSSNQETDSRPQSPIDAEEHLEITNTAPDNSISNTVVPPKYLYNGPGHAEPEQHEDLDELDYLAYPYNQQLSLSAANYIDDWHFPITETGEDADGAWEVDGAWQVIDEAQALPDDQVAETDQEIESEQETESEQESNPDQAPIQIQDTELHLFHRPEFLHLWPDYYRQELTYLSSILSNLQDPTDPPSSHIPHPSEIGFPSLLTNSIAHAYYMNPKECVELKTPWLVLGLSLPDTIEEWEPYGYDEVLMMIEELAVKMSWEELIAVFRKVGLRDRFREELDEVRGMTLGVCGKSGRKHDEDADKCCVRCQKQLCEHCGECLLNRCIPVPPAKLPLSTPNKRNSLRARTILSPCAYVNCNTDKCNNPDPEAIETCTCSEFLADEKHDCSKGHHHFCHDCLEQTMNDISMSNMHHIDVPHFETSFWEYGCANDHRAHSTRRPWCKMCRRPVASIPELNTEPENFIFEENQGVTDDDLKPQAESPCYYLLVRNEEVGRFVWSENVSGLGELIEWE